MYCAVYKSHKKAETYLYIPNKDDFSRVPSALLEVFGKPQLVMVIPIMKLNKLALADVRNVINALENQGFYLQLSPPQENLLSEHKKTNRLLNLQSE